MKYRPEIDGLRALAVISVILCHAGLESFSGGFVGVDIFFVISGYLITSIILTELKEGRFSLLGFYERRARRIFPALLVVLICTYLFSWIFNLPAAHKVVGQYMAASLTFSSNLLLYLKGVDYFGLGEADNPLIHTWSLSVEEQFYIAFPFLLIAISNKTLLKVTVLSVCLISLCIAVIYVERYPIAVFYLMPTRIWEIMIGSIIAVFGIRNFAVNNKSAQLLAFLGLALIVTSVACFGQDTPTPGLYTLIPTLGAAIVIIYASNTTYTGRLLGSRFFTKIGLISYSLYLWHQPVLSYGTKYFSHSSLALIILVIITFILSYLSWALIERTARSATNIATPSFLFAVTSLVSVLILFSLFGHLNNGFPKRNELTQKLTNNTGFGLHCNGNTTLNADCSSQLPPGVAALGNSYMMHFIEPLSEYYGDHGVVQLTQSRCKLGFVDGSFDINGIPCPEFYQRALSTIEETSSIELVFLSSPFTELHNKKYRSSFTDLLKRLIDYKVIILGPTPRAPMNVGECFVIKKSSLKEESNSKCDFSVSDAHKKRVAILRDMSAGFPNVHVVDVTSAICPNGVCEMEPDLGLYMYIDHGHLSRAGSMRVFSGFAEKLPKF